MLKVAKLLTFLQLYTIDSNVNMNAILPYIQFLVHYIKWYLL